MFEIKLEILIIAVIFAVFSRESGCYRHEYEKHASVPGQFECEICGKRWNSRQYLKTHEREVHRLYKDTHLSAEDLEKAKEAVKRFKVREKIDGKIKCFYCDKCKQLNYNCY